MAPDIHTRTAMTVFEVEERKVTPEMRARAKVINFGETYGLTGAALSRAIGSYFTEVPMIENEKLKPYHGIPKRVLISGLRDRGFRLPAATEMAIALNCSREVIIDLRHALDAFAVTRTTETAEMKAVLELARQEMYAAGGSTEEGRYRYLLGRIDELVGGAPVPPPPAAEFLREVLADLPPDLQDRGEKILQSYGG